MADELQMEGGGSWNSGLGKFNSGIRYEQENVESSPPLSSTRSRSSSSGEKEEIDVIGIDVGTTTIKCSLINEYGQVIYSTNGLSAALSYPLPGHVEVNPEEIFANFCQVLRSVISKTKRKQVLLSLSTMSPVMILADKDCKPIRSAILYNDLRSSKEVDEINARFGRKDLLSINGNIANIQQWGPKWLWLEKNEPVTCRKTTKIFDLASFIVYRLTNEHVIDHTVAQEAGLFDYRQRKWSGELLSFFHLDDSVLPTLCKTTDIVGELTPNALNDLNAPDGASVKINAGCVDAVASSLSIGQVIEDEFTFVIGSTGIIAFSTRDPRPDPRLYLDLSPVDGLFYIGGGTSASGLFLDYVLQLLHIEEPRYARAEQLASASPAGAKGVVMLPYIYGERTPILDPLAKSVMFGVSTEVDEKDIVRASLEAIAYSFLHHVKVLKEDGYDGERIKVTGGAARNSVLLKIFSDVMGKTLTYFDNSSATMGDALIGFKSLGIFKDWTEINKWIGSGRSIEPNTNNTQLYRKQFEIYLDLYQKLKDDFSKSANMLGH